MNEFDSFEKKIFDSYEESAVTYLPFTAIEKDPLNTEAFTEEDIENLSEDIIRNGFLGFIVVYPIAKNHYRIESGHRRFEAALAAGISDIPVLITAPPADEYERRQRLMRWNLHYRATTPMNMARKCKFQYDTYEMENERRKSMGFKPIPIMERVARDMDCSVSNVTKYKALLNLIPELQQMVEDGDYSWAILSSASQLTNEQQLMLSKRIQGQSRLLGPTYVTGAWISQEIQSYKKYRHASSEDKYNYDRNDTSFLGDELKQKLQNDILKNSRFRRKDGAKKIKKSHGLLKESLQNDVLFKNDNTDETIKYLKEIEKLAKDLVRQIERQK